MDGRLKLLKVDRKEMFETVPGVPGRYFSGLSVRARLCYGGRNFELAFFHPYFPKRLWAFTQKVAEAKLLKKGSLPKEIRRLKLHEPAGHFV